MDLFFSHFSFLWHQHSGVFIIYYFTYIFIYVWIEMILTLAFWQSTRCMEKDWRKTGGRTQCVFTRHFHSQILCSNHELQLSKTAIIALHINVLPQKVKEGNTAYPFRKGKKYLCINRDKWIYSNPCLQFMAKLKGKTDSWNQFFMDRRKGSSKNEIENTFMMFF